MHYVLVAGGNAFYEKRGRNWQPLPDERMFAYGGSTPDSSTSVPGVMVASAEPAPSDADAAAAVTQRAPAAQPAVAEKAPAAKPTMVAAAGPAPAVEPMTVASVEPSAVPLPAPRPVAFAAAEPQPVPFAMARPDVVAAAADPASTPKKARRRTPVSAPALVEVATAEQPEIRAKKKLIVPDNAPVPTARAGFLPSRKAKQVAPVIETAAEEPSAARFGYTTPETEEAVLSFTQ
jgi:hypothetical protein